MSKIVTEVSARIRCEVFPCKQIAKYAIGPEGRRQLVFNVCGEHFKQIVGQGIEILGIGGCKEPIEEPVGEDQSAPVAAPIVPPFTIPEPEVSEVDEVFGETETNQEPPEPEEVYNCKHCDTTFPKTKEGRVELMTHSRLCPHKPVKE